MRMFLMVSMLVCLVAFTVFAACGDDDDDDDRGNTGGGDVCEGHEACEACKAVLELLCEKTAECSDEITMSECLDELYNTIDCYTAVGVGNELELCLEQMGALDCDAVLAGQIPYMCEGIIIVG